MDFTKEQWQIIDKAFDLDIRRPLRLRLGAQLRPRLQACVYLVPSDKVEDPSEVIVGMDGSGDRILGSIYGDMPQWHRFSTGTSSVLFDFPDAPYFPREIFAADAETPTALPDDAETPTDDTETPSAEIPSDDAEISTDKLPEEIVDEYDIVIQIDELDVDGGANEPIWQHPEKKFGETHEQPARKALYWETMEHDHPIQIQLRQAMNGRWPVWIRNEQGHHVLNCTWTDWHRDELGQLEFIKRLRNTNEAIERGL